MSAVRSPARRLPAVLGAAFWPVVVTGFGFGAFIDGIVFHQLLQWHHFVSAYTPADNLAGLEYNTFWDGVFHVFSWVVTVAGVVWLYERRHAARERGLTAFAGGLLLGWGVFNLVDEAVFHLLLGAHHIRMVDNYWVYDLTYTVVAVALVAAGVRVLRRAGREQGIA